jgi:hypothetical protein
MLEASLKTLKPIDVVGINPLEVAGTKANAAANGIEARVVVGDVFTATDASPSAMIRLFRDNPRKAAELYAGRLVTLPIRKGEFRIFNVTPPVIVSDPPPSFASSTTTGYCVVRRDGIYTGDGCDLTIVLESASHR